MSGFIFVVGLVVTVGGVGKVWEAERGVDVSSGIFLTLLGGGLIALAVMTS